MHVLNQNLNIKTETKAPVDKKAVKGVKGTEVNFSAGSLIKNNYSDEQVTFENDIEVEEFKKKLQFDSIHARGIKKIKPVFTQEWLNDMN